MVAVLLCVFAAPVWAGEKMLMHFVVVGSSDDVTEADFQGLKNLFLEHAGGYTEMPSTVGSSMREGKASPEEVNTTFFVAGKKNISQSIREYVKKNKHLSEPFILVWEAERE